MTDALRTVLDLFHQPEFLAGLGAGAFASVLIFPTALARQALRWPDSLLVVSAAAISGMVATGQAPLSLALGAAIHSGAAVLGTRSPGGALALGLAGSWLLLAGPGATHEAWAIGLTLVAIPAVALALKRFHPLAGSPASAVALAIACTGIWATVPDTGAARVLLGAMLPGLAMLWPGRLLTVSGGGAGALAAVVGFVVADGGSGRPGSMVGAWGCLLVPVAMGWLARTTHLTRAARGWILGTHAAVALWASRVAGFRESALEALLLLVPAALLALPVILGSMRIRDGAARRLPPSEERRSAGGGQGPS